jgi:hypothetical protein
MITPLHSFAPKLSLVMVHPLAISRNTSICPVSYTEHSEEEEVQFRDDNKKHIKGIVAASTRDELGHRS